MSTLLSSSVNLSVFAVSGMDVLRPDDMFAFMQAGLQRFAFKDISETSEEQSVGWAHVEDRMATSFDSPAYILIDKFAFLSLRKDVRKVPSAVLKQEIADRCAAWLSEHPDMKRPPKRIREDIADTAKLHLLGKTLAVPKVLDAVWDTSVDLLYVLSASQSELDLFTNLFHRTFEGLRLCEVVPYQRALGVSVQMQSVYKAVVSANQAVSESLLDLMNSNTWIGKEFALWLMAGSGPVPDFTAWVDDKVALAGEGRKAVFSGPIDNNLVSLRSSLSEGNSVSDVVVHLEHIDGALWRFNLNVESFRMRSVKFPPAKVDYYEDTVTERQATMLCRVDAIRSLQSGFNAYLFEFLRGRLLDGTVLLAIDAWRSEDM